MTSVPKEVCELKPLKICTNEVISLPSLELVNECVQVPKEVCSLEKVNPRQIAKPIIKKWCMSSDAQNPGTAVLNPSGVVAQNSTTTTNNNDQNKIVGIEALTQGGEFNFKPNFFPATDFENF